MGRNRFGVKDTFEEDSQWSRDKMRQIVEEVTEKSKITSKIVPNIQDGLGTSDFYLPDGSVNPDYAIGG